MLKKDVGPLLIMFFVIVLPFAFCIWSWHHLLTSGSWWPVATFGMSFVAASMIGLPVVNLLLPGKMNDRLETRGKYGREAWIAMVVIAFLAASVNYALMSRAFNTMQAAPVYTPPGQE